MADAQVKIIGAHVDIVLCIDVTGSMSPLIENVKNQAKNFYSVLTRQLSERSRPVEELRIKVITFKDYAADGSEAIQESKFFDIPAQQSEYESFISDIEAAGGGDAPENAYEALALAFKSQWTRKSRKVRHITVLFTDAPALPLSANRTYPGYPEDMPENIEELKLLWNQDASPQAVYGLRRNAHRLALYVPNDPSWESFTDNWHKTLINYIKADEGGKDINMDSLMAFFVNSASDAD